MIKLSILICSLRDRRNCFAKLMLMLMKQCDDLIRFKREVSGSLNIDRYLFSEVEILVAIDNKEITTGAKRNILLEYANGDYILFCDDDDEVSENYVSEIVKAINSKPDVVGFEGYQTTNGTNRCNFKISKDLPYITSHDERGILYLRYNNHLSPVKREIALQIKFPDKTWAEDYDYAKRLHESGLIQTEVYIKKDLYHYKFVTDKK